MQEIALCAEVGEAGVGVVEVVDVTTILSVNGDTQLHKIGSFLPRTVA
jgi:hypothetical protein